MLVLDLTRLLPGPAAGRILSELGFDVLRLLPPQGDLTQFLSPDLYAWLNSKKRTETVDLKNPTGRERLLELVPQASVLIETNRPGVMERLGVGPDILRAVNPRLTYVRIAGYRDAAMRESPGHDLTYLAATGLLERFSPAWKDFQFADMSGALWAVVAVLEGLRKGGGFFEVYLEESAFAFAYPKLENLDGRMVCYSVYRAKDGHVALAALEPQLWQRFCAAFNRPDWLAAADSRADESNPVFREISAILLGKSVEEWDRFALENMLPMRGVRPSVKVGNLIPWKEISGPKTDAE